MIHVNLTDINLPDMKECMAYAPRRTWGASPEILGRERHANVSLPLFVIIKASSLSQMLKGRFTLSAERFEFASVNIRCCHRWRRQLWGTGARAPSTSNNFIFSLLWSRPKADSQILCSLRDQLV